MKESKITFRAILAEDEHFLWEMLYQALFVPPGSTPFPREIVYQPEIRRYLEGWGRTGDVGVIAVIETSEELVGAIWIRRFPQDAAGYGYVDNATPELTVAVMPEWRGKGIGEALMTRLFAEMREHYRAVSLSVSENNPALRLYQRLGFVTVKKDSSSLTMMKDLLEGSEWIT